MLDFQITDFAEYMADEARKISQRYFRTPIAIEEKQDSSPVTRADKEIETTLVRLIELNFPEHGVFGEEYGKQREEAEFVWVIDPIDGTKSFITGRPLFGTLISLVQNGKPILGIIDQPITNERWFGVNGSTRLNNKPVTTRACDDISKAYFGTTSPFLFEGRGKDIVEQVTVSSKAAIYGGDCYNYGQLASGHLDIVIESGLKPYDFCALVPIIENAGGKITDWQGQPIDINSGGNVIACGDSKLHKKILSVYF